MAFFTFNATDLAIVDAETCGSDGKKQLVSSSSDSASSGEVSTANLSTNASATSISYTSRIFTGNSNGKDEALVATKKRQRSFATKVRTGCLLCKKRKVKCGEEKPSCARCRLRGQTCAYMVPRTKMFEPGALTGTKAFRKKLYQLPDVTSLSLCYGDDQETASLAFYVKRTGPRLSMLSCTKTFWSSFVPAASWRYAPVRHMLVALSLLDQYLCNPTSTLQKQNAQFFQALKAYNRAIFALISRDQPPSCALMTSILAWMFERSRNYQEEARMHFAAAMKMAAELKKGDQRGLSIDEIRIVESIDPSIFGDRYEFVRIWAPEEQYECIRPFETLDEARAALAIIIKTIQDSKPVRTVEALHDLRRWRLAFDSYKFKGTELLHQKRVVFLHHNIVISRIALQHFEVMALTKTKHIIMDIDTMHANEDMSELSPGLMLLLDYLAEDGRSEDIAKVRKLQRDFRRARRRETEVPKGHVIY